MYKEAVLDALAKYEMDWLEAERELAISGCFVKPQDSMGSDNNSDVSPNPPPNDKEQ